MDKAVYKTFSAEWTFLQIPQGYHLTHDKTAAVKSKTLLDCNII